MNTSLTAYTPLETLLLFQLLKINGVDQHVFGTISDLLKKNRHVRDAKQYDGSRLSPDALRELFTKLVKDEATIEGLPSSIADPETPNGDHAGNSKKRKAPSPALPSFDDATKNPNLIPKLVEKLYSRYRAQVTAEIREEEQRYQRLQREVQEIERGEWDHKIMKQDESNGLGQNSNAGGVPAVDAQPKPKETTNATPPTHAFDTNAQIARSPATKSASPHNRPLQPVVATPIGQTNGKPSDTVPGRPPQTTPSISPAPVSATSSTQVPSQNTAPKTPLLPPPKTPGPLSSPPTMHQPPYPPSQGSTVVQTQHTRSSTSQTPLPPQSNKHLVQPPQPSPYPEAGSSRPNVSPSPAGRSSQPPMQGAPVPQHGPTPANPTYPVPYLQPDGQQQRLPNSHPQQNPRPTVPPPHMLGSQITFQVSPQPPVQTSQQQPKLNPAGTPPVKRGTPKVPATVPTHFPLHPPTSAQALRDQVVRLLGATPIRPGVPRPPPLTTTSTPSSETKWKQLLPRSGPAVGPLRSPSVSPIRDLAPPTSFPVPGPRSTASARGGRSRGQMKTKDLAVSDSVAADEDLRSSRSTRKRGRRTRGTSVTSSAVDSSVRGRTRSHSVASHNDVMSVDENTTAQQVKPEPSTPGMSEDVMPGIEGSSAGAGRRTRGNTVQMTRPGKRKREARDASETAGSEEVLGTPGPQQIVAPRYFSRMSVPLMNDITSHKYASLFSAPVKEKDAEGYKDMIRRPQDLKSIRAAVNVGAKAVAAAASVDTPSGNSPGGGGGNVLLPPSPEVMPPKAIVNSAQLERELMRMFANAVMFNSGEEGVVQDAREMFESVQQAVSNWRSAERTGDSEDVGPEEDNMMASKRRKV